MLVARPCLTVCNAMDFSSPGSSVPGILQARALGWADSIVEHGGSVSVRGSGVQILCILLTVSLTLDLLLNLRVLVASSERRGLHEGIQ